MGRLDGNYNLYISIENNMLYVIQNKFNMQAVVRVEPHDLDVFSNNWNQKMRKNYRETISRAKKAGKKPGWMSDEVWNGFLTYWELEAAKVSYDENAYNYVSCIILIVYLN